MYRKLISPFKELITMWFFLQYYCSKHILLSLDFTVTISSFLLGIEQSSPEKSKSKTMVMQTFGGGGGKPGALR